MNAVAFWQGFIEKLSQVTDPGEGGTDGGNGDTMEGGDTGNGDTPEPTPKPHHKPFHGGWSYPQCGPGYHWDAEKRKCVKDKYE